MQIFKMLTINARLLSYIVNVDSYILLTEIFTIGIENYETFLSLLSINSACWNEKYFLYIYLRKLLLEMCKWIDACL